MAMEVEIFTGQHTINVWIAARSQQIVNAAAIAIHTVVSQRVVRDGCQRSQKRQITPQPIECADVRTLQLSRTRCPHPLAWIVAIPNVQICDLRPLDGDDPAYMAG